MTTTTALMRTRDRVIEFLARVTGYERSTSADRVSFWGPRSFGPTWLTHDEAMRLSAVWACITMMAKHLASSDWDVFAISPNGDREQRRNTTTYRLLNTRPNPETTAIAFHEASLIVAMIWGNFYAEIERDIAGRPAALWPLDPDRCALKRNERKELILSIDNFDRKPTELAYSDVYHIHGPGMDGIAGFDMVAYAARTLAHSKAAEVFEGSYYANGTAMGGVLSTEQPLTKEQRAELETKITKEHVSPENAFRFLVLSHGFKFTPLAATPENAQGVEHRYLLIEEVCRYWGVPPHKIAHLNHATYSNIEHEGLSYQRDALTPWAERCAQEADAKLLPVGPLKVRINTDWLAEGDAMSKAQTDSILVQNGLENRNEARRRRGKNGLGPMGDLLTVQSNLTTIEKIKEAPAPGTGAGSAPGGTPMPAEPDRQTVAARALFAAAMKRCLRRQHHRALDASTHAKDSADFEKRIAAYQASHAYYIQEQLDDVFATLQRIGIAADIGTCRQYVMNQLSKDRELILMAYRAGDVGRWCDVDVRAEEIAQELEAILKGASMQVFAGPPFPAKPRSEKPFYRMEKKDTAGDLYLYDLIGDSWDGTTAKQFAADLKALGEVKTLNIFINSPGGSVFDGVAIYNTLQRHRARKIVHVDGIAASIASLVAMVGDEIRIAANGMMMIHDAWGFAMGNAGDMRKTADTLDKISDTIRETYASRSTTPEDELREMMAEETWFNAEEAVKAGLADTIVEAVEIAALSKFDLTGFKHAPPVAQAAATEPLPGGMPPASDWTPAPNLKIARANVRLARRKLQQGQPSTS